MTSQVIKSFGLSCVLSLFVAYPGAVRAEEIVTNAVGNAAGEPAAEKTATTQSSKELLRQAWAASSQSKWEELDAIAAQCVSSFGEEARQLHSQLSAFPARDTISKYAAMNDVATCLFVQAEGLMHQGKSEQATAAFEKLKTDYKWAQGWDPSRGAYWSVAEKAQASLDVISGKAEKEEELKEQRQSHRTTPQLAAPGKDQIVDYTKYGRFINVGTNDYHYAIKDTKALAAAVGEGIYPNLMDVVKNPNYKKAQAEGRLEGNHWDFVNSEDREAAFFKWATAPEPWGVRLFYIGLIFERSHMYHEALRAYHALMVHYPKTVAWTYWQTPWYPAQAAVAKIKHLVREHPELGVQYKWGKIQIANASDNDTQNDIYAVFPGAFKPKTKMDMINEKLSLDKKKIKLGNPKKTVGRGRVQLVQYENGHWQLKVDGKPWLIKGITYAPTKVGQSADKGTISNWMTDDFNNNGKIDGPYEAWVDKNANNAQDSDEPAVGDFQLIKDMGANTLRIYHQPHEINKELLRDLYKKHGIMVIVGDFMGKYTLGSGAKWEDGTDYENPEHLKSMKESVRKMVMDHKDEPYVLFWLLGNENNYGVASNADKKPEAYFKFVDDVAKMIKEIDPNHPVAVCNGDTLFMDIFAKNAPNADMYAANVYRGDYGFGSFWEQVKDVTGKPAFITEYGAPAFVPHASQEDSEEAQAQYHRGNWLDILENSADYDEGIGNAIGGVAFEWMDEWWKNYEPAKHDKRSEVIGPFPGGYYYEEWFGLSGQGDGKSSPYLRQLRKAYYSYKELWK